MASGLLSLKWNNHRSTFFHVLSTVRSKESYCDVTLACDGKFYPVHKLVLSTCSDYFERMFERTNCKHPIIVLKDIRHEELEALLNYMYVGEVNVLQNELAGLIKAAECLMIKGLAVPDEAPSQTKESKRTYHSSGDSPHAKRRKRDDDGRLSSHNQHLHREGREVSHSQRHSSSASTSTPSSVGRVVPPSSSPSPSVGSASDAVSEECSQSQSETNEAQETSKHPGGEPSSQSKQSVPEVILDEPAVKEEPAEIEEEVTDSKEDVVSQFHFDPLQEGDSRSDPGGGGSGGYDSQMLTSQSQSMEDLVAEALPGSSGLQGNSLWEGEGSLQGFPMEGYSGEGTRPPQMFQGHSASALLYYGEDQWPDSGMKIPHAPSLPGDESADVPPSARAEAEDDPRLPTSLRTLHDPPDRLRLGDHKEEKVGKGQKQKRCRVCFMNGVRRDTTFQCSLCKIALCVVRRDCFMRYHTQQKYWCTPPSRSMLGVRARHFQ
ncbi:longitudinals lacking protein, isoforms H/M/V-like isoform X5 [Macrobrachium nipponense]|uniref:longitudinals lacking protein, isoforms H/M/V-like isoform X5 n=1 Tax=Macrobrachium nipponense TaxID=159736 RepID=UPI0030C89B86